MLKKLLTRVSTIEELKSIFIEAFLNHTNKVSKISDFSVLNAYSYGVSKLFQKDLKDTAVLESLLFPELSSGEYLDKSARMVGGLPRLGSAGSSTYVLVYAEPGTLYFPGLQYFVSTKGVIFDIVQPVEIGANGYSYIPVRSITKGKDSNVDSLTINNVQNKPIGHISCTNEYMAVGGRDEETDEDFKLRLMSFRQFSAKSTRDYLLSYLQTLNPDIIRIVRSGYDDINRVKLTVITCNGQLLTEDEIQSYQDQLYNFVSLSELNRQVGSDSLVLVNPVWHEVGGNDGVDFRVELSPGFTQEEVRKEIQIQLTKYFDLTYWDSDRVEWDDMLLIIKKVRGVKYVADEYFKPNADEPVQYGKLPRIIKFIMRDLNGNILFNNNSQILPIYSM